jgi:hypothetical protein
VAILRSRIAGLQPLNSNLAIVMGSRVDNIKMDFQIECGVIWWLVTKRRINARKFDPNSSEEK